MCVCIGNSLMQSPRLTVRTRKSETTQTLTGSKEKWREFGVQFSTFVMWTTVHYNDVIMLCVSFEVVRDVKSYNLFCWFIE